MRLSVLTLPICLLITFMLTSCRGNATVEELAVGHKSPRFSLISLDGTTVTNDVYKDKIIILNFWATWCRTCKKEIPDLNALSANPEVEVIGIALDQGGEKKVRSFLKRVAINYNILLGNDKVFKRFNGSAIPYTLVLDRKQHVTKIYRGPATREELEQEVQKIIQGTI